MTHRIQTAKYINLESGEVPEILVRKHWIVFVAEALGVFFVSVLVILFFKYFINTGSTVSPSAVFIIFSIFIILWLALFTLWTNYYLDIWIVTNRRIINIDQISLFRRNVSSMRDEHVQDVVVQKRGILQELLNYGTVRVQSAGADNIFFIIKGIPNPAKIQKAILKRAEKLRKSNGHH